MTKDDCVKLTDKNFKAEVLESKIPVFVDFWGSWCPPCKMSLAELNELQAKQMEEEFALLAISVDEEISAVKSFTEHYYLKYPVLIDDKGVSDIFAAYQLPTTIVIGKDGRVLKHHRGYSPDIIEELLLEAIDEEKTNRQGDKLN